MNSTGNWGYDPSSERYKENIRPAEGTSKIYDLNVVDFNMIGSNENRTGLIAEQVAEINPDWVTYRTEVIKECWNDTSWIKEGIKECKIVGINVTNEPESNEDIKIMYAMLKEIQRLEQRVSILEGTKSP